MTPNVNRHAAGISMGAFVLPLTCRTHGTRFCAIKPPTLPSELIAAIPAAARAPVRNFDGSVQKHGSSKYMHGAPRLNAMKRNVLVGRKTLPRKNITPSIDAQSIAVIVRSAARNFDGNHARTIRSEEH